MVMHRIDSCALRACSASALLLSLSCAHASGERQPAQRTSARAPAHSASQPEPSAARPHPPAKPPPLAPEDAPEQDRIESFMAEHFAIVTWARDSVIAGSVEPLREPLRALADYEYRSVAPGGWMPYIADLQEAARLTSQSDNLDLAATGVATMARVCGDCHANKASGPKFNDSDRRDERRLRRDSLDQRMQRHIWAADRMWEGLTGPSDAAWSEGAAALANAPAGAPRADPALPPKIVSALQEVRALGARALDAQTLADRADVYGLLLSTCANCHAYQVEFLF